MESDLLRVVTAGSVDDGKSTLIGRLLFDSKQVLEDQLSAVERTSAQRGAGYLDLSLLTDGLRAEREQGITIDVAYRYFATVRRKFILADTPGHERYTRNMVTGASTADLAIILVDARQGVVEQTRRHAFIASLLGISHIVVCVNKMDLVEFERASFARVEEQFSDFAAKLQVKDVAFIPISALQGDNVVERSTRMPWYVGPSLLYHLEHVHIASDRNLIDCRFPVQWVVRPQTDEHHDYRGYAGQIASGILRRGDEVVVLPSMVSSRVAKIDTLDGEVGEAFPPMSVTVLLEDDLDVSRGDMLCRPNNLPTTGQDCEALLCWMGEKPLALSKSYVLRHTTRSVRASVQAIRYRIDVNSLSRDENIESLAMNEIGRVLVHTATPIFYDDYKKNRETGSFVLVDEATNHTVAGGMLLAATVARRLSAPPPRRSGGSDSVRPPATGDEPLEPRSPNVVAHTAGLTRSERYSMLRTCGAVVWLTGLSGAGKSTIGAALERRVVLSGRSAYLLDGDNLRHGLCGDLGFSREDRDENVRRAGHAALLLAEAGTVAVVALISPYAEARERVRRFAENAEIPFVEVHVATDLEECERRDVKGLYQRARAGEIPAFTGVHEPYEPPLSAEVRVDGTQAVDDSVESIMIALRERGVTRPDPDA